MYNDWLTIGPVTIHGYGACIAIGLLLALFMASYRGKKKNLNDDVIYGIVFIAAVFGFLFAKLMYCLVEWKDFIKDPLSFISSSGFVVYGGITGGILAVMLYCKIKKVKFIDYLELCMPSVALAQAFGRVGCFFAGLWLDRHFGTQWCAIVLFFIGALAGFTNIYKLTREFTKEYTANHEDRKSPEGEMGAAQGSGGAVHRDSSSRDTDTGGSSDIL